MSTFVSSSTESSNVFKIVSNDGETFDISQEAAIFSTELVKMIGMLKDNEDQDAEENNTFNFPNLPGATIKIVLEFLNHIVVEPMNEILRKPIKTGKIGEVVQEWYVEFISTKDIQEVCKISNAAEFLGIRSLLDLCCAHLACVIKTQTSAVGIANLFGIEEFTASAFTPEEEKRIRDQNKWIDNESCEL